MFVAPQLIRNEYINGILFGGFYFKLIILNSSLKMIIYFR